MVSVIFSTKWVVSTRDILVGGFESNQERAKVYCFLYTVLRRILSACVDFADFF